MADSTFISYSLGISPRAEADLVNHEPKPQDTYPRLGPHNDRGKLGRGEIQHFADSRFQLQLKI